MKVCICVCEFVSMCLYVFVYKVIARIVDASVFDMCSRIRDPVYL